MTTVTLTTGIRKRPAPAPTLACQRVGGCPAGATVTALLVAALLVAASLFCVWSRIEVVRQGYALSELSKEIKDLEAAQERLRVEAAGLRSPERIESLAREKLQMQFPAPAQIRTVEVRGRQSIELASRSGR